MSTSQSSVFFRPFSLKNIAWLTLFLHICSVSSVTLASFSSAQLTYSDEFNKIMSSRVQPYILQKGETPETVAKRFGLTLDQLKAFNQFRIFQKPFSQLKAGSEIDVPVRPLLSEPRTEKKSPPQKGKPAYNAEEIGRLTNNLQLAGNTLKNFHNLESVTSKAHSLANSEVNNRLQKWLSQFGTAQVNLGISEYGELANSAFDWLIPFYNEPKHTWFLQTGSRNQDNRNTFNVGWGYRYLNDNWMIGGNHFFDYDITGNNRRFGLGIEFSTQYLQFSGNTYLRLNNWHQSRDFADYDERAANGFDIRAEGAFPAFPQLSGKLEFEQYYGNEVALFGKENRQRNPYAVTSGLSWTPFPLFTVGMDKRFGGNGKNEMNINLQFTWRPDESLAAQLRPSDVSALYQPENRRHALVKRNNQIVLDYRKQTLIKLSLNSREITGLAGSHQSLIASVTAKYGLYKVHLAADSLMAAGGKVTPLDKTHFSLTLPPYQMPNPLAEVEASNAYLLSLAAEDIKGNRSPLQSVIVTVLPPEVNFNGELQVINDGAPADQITPVTVIAQIEDSYKNSIENEKVEFVVRYVGGQTFSQTVNTDEQGKARLSVTSAVAGEATVTATAAKKSKTTTLHFVPVAAITSRSILSTYPDTLVADGRAKAIITLLARDEADKPVSGKASELSFVATGVSNLEISAVAESPAGSGTYTAEVKGTAAGNAILLPLLNGIAIKGLSATLILTEPLSTTQAVATINLTREQAGFSATPVTAQGGIPPYRFTVSPALPDGLTMDASSGTISGSPRNDIAAQIYTVTVMDSANSTSTNTFMLTVSDALVAVQTVATLTLTAGQAEFSAVPVTASGGRAPYHFTVKPALPDGLLLDSSSGTVSGTPVRSAAAKQYTVTINDANGVASENSFTLGVNDALLTEQNVADIMFTAGQAGINVTPVTASGGTLPYRFSASPALPDGLTINEETGNISGAVATLMAAKNYTVSVTDANGVISEKTFSLGVNEALGTIQSLANIRLAVQQPDISVVPVTVTGGTAPYHYSVSPALPNGLEMNVDNGTIGGTPTRVTELKTYTVTVTDANGQTANRGFALEVVSSVMIHSEVSKLLININNIAIKAAPFSSSGGKAPYTYSIVDGSLPEGLSMSAAGEISGRVTNPGLHNYVTIKSTDADNIVSANSVEVEIAFVTSGVIRVGKGMKVTHPECLMDGEYTTNYVASCVTYDLIENLGFVPDETFFDIGFGGEKVVAKGAMLIGYWRQEKPGSMGSWQLEGCSTLLCDSTTVIAGPFSYQMGKKILGSNDIPYPAYRFRYVGGKASANGGSGSGSITELVPIF